MRTVSIILLILSLFLFDAACAQSRVATQFNEMEYPSINGLRQAISIQGDTSGPLLLFLHGGPGRSLMPFAGVFTKTLPDYFTVVQWDQRGTGETQKKNPGPVAITQKLIEKDALAMVRYLLKRFHRRKLYLVSHSWGSVPGFAIAKRHPELLHSYVAISPVIDLNQSMALTVGMLRSWAESMYNDTAAKELSGIHVPYRNEDDMFTAQKWLFIHNGVEGAGSATFKDDYYDWMRQWFPVWMASAQSNAFIATPALKCPFWLFEGRGDNQMPAAIAERYFEVLNARHKHLIWFEQSGHTIFNTEPQKVEQVLIDSVLHSSVKALN